MNNRSGIFAGDDPFEIARSWLAEAEKTEINDPNAMALATVDDDGLPNARMVLLKEIGQSGTAVLMPTHDYALLLKFPHPTYKCSGGTVNAAVQRTL